MSQEPSISIRSWILALTRAMVALSAILLVSSPSHRWQPEKVTIAPHGNDFLQEWIGGYLILAGSANRLYDTATFEACQHDPAVTGFEWSRATYFPPVYPPPHYLLATTLAWIPYRVATILWLCLLVAAMLGGCWVAAKHVVRIQAFSGDPLAKSLLDRWSWVAIVLFVPTIYCFIIGQKGPFWLLLFAATWALLRRQKDGWAGLVFGLLSIKPTLFFLLPLVMLRYRKWRFLAGTSVSITLLWGGAFAVLPLEVWSGFAEKLGMSSSYAAIRGYHLDWSCNLMSLSYISQDSGDIGLIKWFIVLPLILYGLRLVAFPRNFDTDHPDRLWSLMVVTLLLSPHAYYYDLVILLVPLLWYAAVDPKRCVSYYLLIAASVVIAPITLEFAGIPLIPIILVGMLFEQQLRNAINNSRQVEVSSYSCSIPTIASSASLEK
jgi:Glycosyltransferase family 87